ncbi:MAG: BTAD domain-containing putative transcriptional regulator [Acidimicrobiales bacterium]
MPVARSFRFSAPALRRAAVLRRRLLAVLQRRWEHRVTVVVGGAGLGKTTLLAQAIAENQLEPRGQDVWLGLDSGDADGALASDLLRALGDDPGSEAASADVVADAVWSKAPAEVCLVLDDVHALAAGSPGQQLVADLIDALPANGHVVLASRSDPAIPMARLAASGGVLRVTESQLRYNDAELAEVAAIHGIDPATLGGTGGWPAMAELVASAGSNVADDYLWQEVIEPLGHDRRRILATLVELGGADDALMSAALGSSVNLGDALASVPLVDVDNTGWFRPHDLWRPMARLRLAEAERGDVLRRAVDHLTTERRFDEAFRLVEALGLWDEAPALLRASCLQLTNPGADLLYRWLRACPASVRSTPAGLLATAVHAVLDDPDTAVDPLRRAIVALRAADDVDGELAAITHLGRVAYWTQNTTLRDENSDRIRELRKLRHPVAEALTLTGRALRADLNSDDAAALAASEGPLVEHLGDAWAPVIGFCRVAAHYARGDLDAAVTTSTPLIERYAGGTIVIAIESVHLQAEWYRGRLDEPPGVSIPQYERAGDLAGRHDRTLRAAEVSRHCSFTGDVDIARIHLDAARSEAVDDRPLAAVRVALADASLHVALGDEARAAAVLREAIEKFGLDRSSQRRAWRDGLCLTYVLLPEARPVWEASPVVGAWAHSRRLAAAVVASREGIVDDTIRGVDVSDVRVVSRLLHYRFAAELAVGLASAGRSEGADVLDQLGPPGRTVVRELSGQDGVIGRAARSLLATVPVAPPETVELGVLGPLQLRRDGVPVEESGFRRERVRALLAYLTLHRTTTRPDVIAALWPDFDERSGANNLRVTLNHLLQALEPWRSEREPPYLLRADATDLRLVRDPQLRIDLDNFDAEITAARRAERDGVPSQALDAYLAAAELWRGDLFCDVTDQAWLELEREQVRSRYVGALLRAAQLLAGRGTPDDVEQAEDLARRAIDVDSWAEAAYGVLIAAALSRGDRSAARRLLQRSRAVADELGVAPSVDIQAIARRMAMM